MVYFRYKCFDSIYYFYLRLVFIVVYLFLTNKVRMLKNRKCHSEAVHLTYTLSLSVCACFASVHYNLYNKIDCHHVPMITSFFNLSITVLILFSKTLKHEIQQKIALICLICLYFFEFYSSWISARKNYFEDNMIIFHLVGPGKRLCDAFHYKTRLKIFNYIYMIYIISHIAKTILNPQYHLKNGRLGCILTESVTSIFQYLFISIHLENKSKGLKMFSIVLNLFQIIERAYTFYFLINKKASCAEWENFLTEDSILLISNLFILYYLWKDFLSIEIRSAHEKKLRKNYKSIL